jgi:hypothetical protein
MLHQLDIPSLILTYKAVDFPEFKLTSRMWKFRFVLKTKDALSKLRLWSVSTNHNSRGGSYLPIIADKVLS